MNKLIKWLEGWLPVAWALLATIGVTAFLLGISLVGIQWVLRLLGVL